MSESSLTSTSTNGFTLLGKDIWGRTCSPMRHVTFWVYLLLGVVLCSGLGVWFEVIRYAYGTNEAKPDAILVALLTFFPALVGSSSLQMVFGSEAKGLRAFALLLVVVFALAASWLAFGRPTDFSVAMRWALFFSVVAIWIWWIANGADPSFRDTVPVNAPIGGDPSVPLSGSLDGFKH
ncbi:hypothetical protein ACFSCV_10950 [Methylopila henanensis]|uniref:DUF805 domain-containing protein n=1 Tax=Methylopila henanensis TaxID=873516 RepID=A0ABW4K8V5_9HYPH